VPAGPAEAPLQESPSEKLLICVEDDGIVVVGRAERQAIMAGRIPAALRTQLGNDATFGLIELLETERKEVSQHVLAMAGDRFERRMAEEFARFRQEVVHELANTRVDMLKWAFVFWIGQVAAVAGLLAYMVR
jgi:hypothetical protein